MTVKTGSWVVARIFGNFRCTPRCSFYGKNRQARHGKRMKITQLGLEAEGVLHLHETFRDKLGIETAQAPAELH